MKNTYHVAASFSMMPLEAGVLVVVGARLEVGRQRTLNCGGHCGRLDVVGERLKLCNQTKKGARGERKVMAAEDRTALARSRCQGGFYSRGAVEESGAATARFCSQYG